MNPAALARALPFLRCPHCGEALALDGGAVRCERGHAFDVGRPGYVSLLTGRGGAPGDLAAVIGARERFLAAGHFDPLARALGDVAVALLDGRVPGCVADLGAGTGWYLAHVLDRLPARSGVALDASRPALRRAARAHPRAAAVGCDIWQALPLRSGAAALVVNVFAPRNAAEIARVLAPGGGLAVVTPTARHLAEVRDPLGMLDTAPGKPAHLEETLAPGVVAAGRREHEHVAEVSHPDLRALARMGPSAYHTEPEVLARRVAALPDPVPVTVSVVFSTFRATATD